MTIAGTKTALETKFLLTETCLKSSKTTNKAHIKREILCIYLVCSSIFIFSIIFFK